MFVVSTAKIKWQPSLICIWFGFIIGLDSGDIYSKYLRKIITLHIQIMEITLQKTFTTRYIANIVRKIVSLHIVLGPVAGLTWPRNSYGLISSSNWAEPYYSFCNTKKISISQYLLNNYCDGFDTLLIKFLVVLGDNLYLYRSINLHYQALFIS